MATANTSLEKTLALGTAGNEILNNPERVGNGLKTLALRKMQEYTVFTFLTDNSAGEEPLPQPYGQPYGLFVLR